jgi:hypothetical protein
MNNQNTLIVINIFLKFLKIKKLRAYKNKLLL